MTVEIEEHKKHLTTDESENKKSQKPAQIRIIRCKRLNIFNPVLAQATITENSAFLKKSIPFNLHL